MNDLLKGKNLEIVAASLLLLGKLKVDSVQIYRSQPIIYVSLIGEFKSLAKDKEKSLADFLERNDNMTVDEILEGIKKAMNKE